MSARITTDQPRRSVARAVMGTLMGNVAIQGLFTLAAIVVARL